jgi:hypothetical protein
MAVIANFVAAPGQWTPSLLKSGKPRALSMLEAVTATSSSEACRRTRSGVATGSRKENASIQKD